MPAYSYKERFVPLILEGSKKHTIRARRKHVPKAGQMAYNYFGMRTKFCRKLNESKIAVVKGISITNEHGIVLYERALDDMELEVAKIDPLNVNLPLGQILHSDMRDAFAWNDGFRPEGSCPGYPIGAYDLMIRFWKQTHDLPFTGDVISWQ